MARITAGKLVVRRGERRVVRFSAAERGAHLLYIVTFFTLVLTGFSLYLPQLSAFAAGAAGQTTRLIHRLAAVFFMAAPVLYLLFDAGGFWNSLRTILSWGPEDRAWVRTALKLSGAYWTGDRTGIPPQGRYNTGQKLHGLVQFVAFWIFVVTGLMMWFGVTSLPPWLFQLSVILHDIAILLAVGSFIIHFYLALFHPMTRIHINAMVDGTLSEEDVRTHYSRWYEEIKSGGNGVRESEIGDR